MGHRFNKRSHIEFMYQYIGKDSKINGLVKFVGSLKMPSFHFGPIKTIFDSINIFIKFLFLFFS